MLVVAAIGFLTGFGWACFGILVAAILKSIDNFNYVTSTVITPMFLVAGTFFPLSGLPKWAQVLGQFNPLHHCVELVRHAAFGLARVGRRRACRRPARLRARHVAPGDLADAATPG